MLKWMTLAWIVLNGPIAAGDEPAANDPAKILGTWSILSAELDGRKVPITDIKDQRMIFEEDRYVVKMSGATVEEGTYTLDLSRTPRPIDLKIVKGMDQGETQHGVYELDGDMLKVAFARPGAPDRPRNFNTMPGSGCFSLVLKRESHAP